MEAPEGIEEVVLLVDDAGESDLPAFLLLVRDSAVLERPLPHELGGSEDDVLAGDGVELTRTAGIGVLPVADRREVNAAGQGRGLSPDVPSLDVEETGVVECEGGASPRGSLRNR